MQGCLIALSFVEMLRPLFPSFVCGALMGFLAWILGIVCSAFLPIEIVPMVQIFFGMGIYITLVVFSCRDDVDELRVLISGLGTSPRPQPSL